MKKLNKIQATDLILNSNGQIFGATYIKKDGSKRNINCRVGVSKGVNGNGLRFDAFSKGLVPVWDMKVQGYRMLNFDTLKELRIAGEIYTVSK